MRIVGATRLTGFRAVDGTPGKDSGRRSVQIPTFSDDRQHPAEMLYQMAAEKAAFQAADAHISLGQQARAQGRAADALAEFERAHALAAALAAASQELAATRTMMRRNDRLTPLERMKQEQEEERDRILPVPELQAGTNGAITLTMVNQSPKVLFETVGKHAGMNVLFDPEYQPGKNF